jgi:hypothetical protein
VYTIVICWDFWIRKHEKSNGKIVQRIVDAFKTSLGVFTDAAMIFAIAINVAALCSTRNADSSIVEVSLAEEAAFFASITVVLLDTLNDFAYDNAKRKKERTAVIVVFTVLYIITNYATQYAYPKSDWPTWEDYCSINVMYGQALATTILKDVLFGCFWLWVLIIYFFPWVSKKCLPRVANWLIKWRPASKIGCLVISVILVWALLIDMTVTRQLLLEWSGTDTSDVEWSFGQVIALMTWLPILIELGYLISKSKRNPDISK